MDHTNPRPAAQQRSYVSAMDGFLKRGMTKASALATLLGVGVGGALARFRAPLFPDLLDLSGPEPSEAAFTRAAGLVAAALLVFAAHRLPFAVDDRVRGDDSTENDRTRWKSMEIGRNR